MEQTSRCVLEGYMRRSRRQKNQLMLKKSFLLFFILSCANFLLSLLWVEIVTRQKRIVNESFISEVLENVGRDVRYSDVYRKRKYLPKYLKYILLWNIEYAPFPYFSFLEDGQITFLKKNCSVSHCYITANKWLLGDYRKFHAIAFNNGHKYGVTSPVHYYNSQQLPWYRSPNQKYIYFSMESADNYPVCSPEYDDFFNLTVTYKLDSDIPIPYMVIRDKDGVVIGPNRSMTWRKNMDDVKIDKLKSVTNKTKLAAWFVSNCRSRNRRHVFVEQLQKALSHYGYEIDVFGACGKLKCPKSLNVSNRMFGACGKLKCPKSLNVSNRMYKDECESLLKRDYLFYMALENSFSEDYVTEKLLTALNNNAVPIVFGGADYSRFLPPGSYINGRTLPPDRLASLMVRLARYPDEYNRYFSWKKYYSYSEPIDYMCKICEALNDDTLMKKTTGHKTFRHWWNPKNRCHL